MTILITGGTGYLGGAVFDQLSQKEAVRLLIRDQSRVPSNCPETTEVVVGDLLHRDSLARALKGCHAVIHCAALVRHWTRDSTLFEAVNVEGLRNLVELSQQEGVQQFLYTSSFLALPPTEGPSGEESFLNPYVASKQKALALARAYQKKGYPLTIVIPTVLYGPGRRTEGNHVSFLLEKLLEGNFPGWFDEGRWVWNFAYIDDVARGYLQVLTHGKPGSEYLLGGENMSLRAFFSLAAHLAGCPVPQKEVPHSTLVVYAAFQELMAKFFSRPPSLTRGILATYRHDWAFQDPKAGEEIGYTTTAVQEGLHRTLQWLKGNNR